MSGAAQLPQPVAHILQAIRARQIFAAGKAAFYMNRTMFEMLDIQRREDVRAGGQLKYEVVDGMNTPTFRGIPIRTCDAILSNEAQVS